jgi:hypothetical protein
MPEVAQQPTPQPQFTTTKPHNWKKVILTVIFIVGVVAVVVGIYWFMVLNKSSGDSDLTGPVPKVTTKTATESAKESTESAEEATKPPLPKNQPKAPDPEIIEHKTKGPYQIQIVGDTECKSNTNKALNVLKSEASVHYSVVINNVGVIECSESGSGMYVWEDPPRYKVGKATMNAGTIWYAGTIAHDACHSKQYHDYLFDNPISSVPSNVYSGKSAEAQCLDAQYDSLVSLGASQSNLNYVKNIINSEYWDVDYGDRWW